MLGRHREVNYEISGFVILWISTQNRTLFPYASGISLNHVHKLFECVTTHIALKERGKKVRYDFPCYKCHPEECIRSRWSNSCVTRSPLFRCYRDILCFIGFKELCLSVPQISILHAKCSGVFKAQNTFLTLLTNNSIISTLTENIYQIRTTITQPLTGRNRRRATKCMDE